MTTTVLIVDDEPDLRLLLRLSLERAGFEVVEAQDGEEALERYGSADVMVLDIRMPGIDGFEVLRRLPSPPPKPVVGMSAHTGHEAAREALELGCAKFFFKPFNATDLIAELRRLVAA